MKITLRTILGVLAIQGALVIAAWAVWGSYKYVGNPLAKHFYAAAYEYDSQTRSLAALQGLEHTLILKDFVVIGVIGMLGLLSNFLLPILAGYATWDQLFRLIRGKNQSVFRRESSPSSSRP
jgi:hypothetical protein